MSKFSIALRLFVITAVATLCLALTHQITKDITIANNEKAAVESRNEVLSKAKNFKQLDPVNTKDEAITINSVYAGYTDKKQTKLAGYVITVTSSEGYGGNLCVTVGIDKDGNVTKALISSPFNETAGLGAKAKEASFINQYKGKSKTLKVVKGDANSDDEIAAISSATITSNAVTNCVNAAIKYVTDNAKKSSDAAIEAQKTYEEKDEQSKAELEAVEKNRENEPTPVIKEETDKEDDNE